MSGNTVQTSGFPKLVIIKVNVNVEWDFSCDFQFSTAFQMKNVMFSISPDHHKRWSSAPKHRFTTCHSLVVLNKKWQRRHLPMLLWDFCSSRQCAGPFYHHLLAASSLLASWLGITTWWQTCSQQELHLLKECLKKKRNTTVSFISISPFFLIKLLSLLGKLDLYWM